MAIGIKEIAERAGVSLAAVSLALNNKPGIGKGTRRRVLQIAEELNYTSSRRMSAFNSQGIVRFLQIARHGHTVNRDHKVFISEYIDGMVQTAKTNNVKIEVTSFISTPIEEIVASIEKQEMLDGAIILGTELSYEDVKLFGRVETPIVFLDTFIEYQPFDFVDMNNEDSVFAAIEHFTRHGHREIGMVRSSVQTRNFALRFSAFKRAMSFLGHLIVESYIFNVDSTFEGAFRDMRDHLSKGVRLPTALFCTNDIIAFGVIKALREAGIRVPADISIIGFDDLPMAEVFDPPLTSISVSKREIGSVAMMRLAQRIDAKDISPVKIVIGGTLVERDSVRPYS